VTADSAPRLAPDQAGRRYIRRLDHFIWVVWPENLLAYVGEAERLFGVEFEHMHGPTLAGTDRDCYVSWDAGLEFMAPLGDGDPTSAQFLEFLKGHGEGPWGFVFGVEDLEEPLQGARAAGYPVGELVQQRDVQARQKLMRGWTSRVDDVREVYVGTFLRTEIMFGDIRYRGDN
jgi:hypothetical protein